MDKRIDSLNNYEYRLCFNLWFLCLRFVFTAPHRCALGVVAKTSKD